MNFTKFFHWLCRLSLSAVFIYAAYEKIINPDEFAETINNYRLFPLFTIGPLALVLPWLELICAFFVLFGLWLKPASFILALLLIGFIAAVSFNLYRGLDFECGCFGSGADRQAGWNLIWQDGLLLLASLFLFFKKGKPHTGLHFS